MVGIDPLDGRRRPVHGARHGLTRDTERRLADLGRRLPPPSDEDQRAMAADRSARRARRLAGALAVVLVVGVVAGGAFEWFRPLPGPTAEGLAAAVALPGAAPPVPWPARGEAAVTVPGVGTLASPGPTRPLPVAGVIGVLTAYVVLKDHPLATGGATGPAIAVPPQALAAYEAGKAAGDPEIPVTAGETLSELDALEGLLVNSGNDMATLLAVWDAGSIAAFVDKMGLAALSLGLEHTRVTDPSGADPATVSTPADLVRLAEAAMRIPVLSQIVSLGETNLPNAGTAYNPNFVLGRDGIVGVAVSSDTATGGAYLFAAQKSLDGRTVTLYGAVLGQSGPAGPDTAAVEAGDALVRAVLPAVATLPLLAAGHAVGTLSTPWGASSPLVVAAPVSVVGWPGLRVPVSVHLAVRTAPVPAGTTVGELVLGRGATATTVALRSTAAIGAPPATWRLTR